MGWMAPLRHLSAKLLADRISSEWEPSMGEVTTIGLDLAKHVFQVHGVDAEGATVLRKQLRRAQVLAFFSRLPPCLVGLEACGTAHYWARELRALGHEVELTNNPAWPLNRHRLTLAMLAGDGQGAVAAIREVRLFQEGRVPVLACGAMGFDVKELVEAGADDYLPYPCETAELEARLRVMSAERYWLRSALRSST